MATVASATREKVAPALKTRFYSHATLDCKDIAFTRKFFEEFLGFETVQMAPVAFWARKGGEQIIVVVQGPPKGKVDMPFLNHNGLDVATEAEVDEAYETVKRDAGKWGLHKVSKPAIQHGTYCFYFWDVDDNCWEILCNPEGGYSWGFDLGDQEGAGHLSRKFQRPASTLTKDK